MKESKLILKGQLSAKVIRKNGKVEVKGVISKKVVTDAGVAYLVDAFQGLAAIANFKYHDSGTGTNAEAVGDTALQTPTAESRDSGTQIEGSTANIYKTVATHTFAGTFAITEHGIFSATSTGTLWDRSKFSPINVVSNDRIEWTYELSVASGG